MHELLRGHASLRPELVARSRAFVRELASEGPSPDELFVGCADSRVIPDLLVLHSRVYDLPGALAVYDDDARFVAPGT